MTLSTVESLARAEVEPSRRARGVISTFLNPLYVVAVMNAAYSRTNWCWQELPSSTSCRIREIQRVDSHLHPTRFVCQVPLHGTASLTRNPAIKLVNSSTPYVYDPRTRTYLQPEFSYQILQRFLKVNSAAITDLKIGKEFVVGRRPLPVGTPLVDVINAALRDHSLAPAALKTVFEEIARQNT